MDQSLGQDFKDLEKRKEFLKDNCDAVEQKTYMKQYSNEELAEMKDNLSTLSITINDIEEEKKIVMDDFKERLKPLLSDKQETLIGLKQKAKLVEDRCYKFIDQDTKMVGWYNEFGILIESRSAMPQDLQGTIFQMNRKTGTDDAE